MTSRALPTPEPRHRGSWARIVLALGLLASLVLFVDLARADAAPGDLFPISLSRAAYQGTAGEFLLELDSGSGFEVADTFSMLDHETRTVEVPAGDTVRLTRTGDLEPAELYWNCTNFPGIAFLDASGPSLTFVAPDPDDIVRPPRCDLYEDTGRLLLEVDTLDPTPLPTEPFTVDVTMPLRYGPGTRTISVLVDPVDGVEVPVPYESFDPDDGEFTVTFNTPGWTGAHRCFTNNELWYVVSPTPDPDPVDPGNTDAPYGGPTGVFDAGAGLNLCQFVALPTGPPPEASY